MHYLSIILGFATAASALDIYLHTSRTDCSGPAIVCTGINPNTCCGIPTGSVASIGFRGIVNDWFIEVRGHEGGRCGPIKTLDTAFQTNFKCLSQGPYTGAGYGFRGKKRGAAAVAEKCTPPDLLILEGGKKYSLVGMEDSQLDELVALVSNGTNAAEIPDVFKTLEKVE
ncbi:hypothetical protein BGZ60DRAFT_423325 [Tricladium varicosporioides]|nr:hypothetical protein BGZ60DRAFT_423325 [Hymenoscyphus varicosporioides]